MDIIPLASTLSPILQAKLGPQSKGPVENLDNRSGLGYDLIRVVPRWRNWQTRCLEGAVAFGPCGFDSRPRHQSFLGAMW